MAASKTRRRIRIGLATFWLSVFGWLFLNMQARDVAPSVLKSDPRVEVSDSRWTLTLSPIPDTAQVALAFYPGALVEPTAYAPLARDIAEAGYHVVILKLPYRQAPLENHRSALFDRTREIVHEDDRAWVLGGHSRGGALAAQFAENQESDLAGLILIGTSHPRETDLSALALDVTKVFGANDGLASEEEVRQFSPNLPDETHYIRIEGANHAQFGWYGWQFGDRRAQISRAEQHGATVEAVLEQLRRLEMQSRSDVQ